MTQEFKRDRVLEIMKPKTLEQFERMIPVEMCTCSHFRKEHGDKKYRSLVIAIGHGKCMYGGMSVFCPCEKFTWNGKYSL